MGDKAVGGANGKQGRAFVDTNFEICVEEWNLTETAREEEITNSCSQGKEEYEYGTKHLEINFIFTLDLSQHPFDDPPELEVGNAVSEMFLFEHQAPGAIPSPYPAWYIPNSRVVSCSVSCPAIGKVRYELNLKSVGLYYRPYELAASGA